MGWSADRCTGGTPTSSSDYAGFPVGQSVDDNAGTMFAWATPSGAHWWQYEFAVAVIIEKLSWQGWDPNPGLSAFDLVASNTGAFGGEEVTLQSASGLSWSGYEVKTWEFSNDTAYLFYRVRGTNSSVWEPAICEVEMFESEGLAVLVPAASLVWTPGQPTVSPVIVKVPVGSLVWQAQVPVISPRMVFIPLASLPWAAWPPSNFPLAVSIPAVSIQLTPEAPAVFGKIDCGLTDFDLTLRNTTDAEKSALFVVGTTVSDWADDLTEYHSAPQSCRADLPSPPLASMALMRADLVCQQATTISVWLKVASAATRIVDLGGSLGEQACGGVLVVQVLDSGSALIDSVAIGGWRDWANYELTITDPGNYQLQLIYADLPLSSFGITEWPEVPEGETATDQAWLDDAVTDPTMQRQAGIVFAAHMVGPAISFPNAANLSFGAQVGTHFIGEVWPVPSADLASVVHVPDFLSRIVPGDHFTRTHITEYTNISDPDSTRKWEADTYGNYFETSPGIVLPQVPQYWGTSIMQFEADFPAAGKLSIAVKQLSTLGQTNLSPLVSFQVGYLNEADEFQLLRELDKYEIPDWDAVIETGWKIVQLDVAASEDPVRLQVRVTHETFSGAVLSTIYLSDIFAEYSEAQTGYPVDISITPLGPLCMWQIPVCEQFGAKLIYECTLTGDGEDPVLDDVVLPISSMSARQKTNAQQSYLSVVVSDITTYGAAVAARTNGEIIVKRGYMLRDGRKVLQEIARANLSDLRLDYGPRNQSMTLTGYKTRPAHSGTTRAVSSASYKSVDSEGKKRFRTAIDHFLSPGDTAVVDGESIVVDEISYTVSPAIERMELAEA